MNPSNNSSKDLRDILKYLHDAHCPKRAFGSSHPCTCEVQPALEAIQAHTERLINEAVDEKLVTLSQVVPLLELCETDAEKILIWVKNHRWSLIAPKGKDTQESEQLQSNTSGEDK